jgi:hypothetical protein
LKYFKAAGHLIFLQTYLVNGRFAIPLCGTGGLGWWDFWDDGMEDGEWCIAYRMLRPHSALPLAA